MAARGTIPRFVRPVMRFCQIDRITELMDGERLTAIKGLSLSEEYLRDHFPRYPLMPGVVMLEALFQASMWLHRATDRFAYPIVALREARNVRFRERVSPGDQLVIETELVSVSGPRADFSASARVGELPAVSARLSLERWRLAEHTPSAVGSEPHMLSEFRRLFMLLLAPHVLLSEELRQVLGDPLSVGG